MPGKEEVSTEDTKTTATLLGTGAAVVGVVSACAAENSNVGVFASLAAAAAGIFFFHEVGKNQRVLANAAHNAKSAIGLAKPEDGTNNTVNNIVTGGRTVYDALSGGPK